MVYNTLHFIVKIFMKIVFRFESDGADNVPEKSGAVVASNHISLWDPTLIGCGLPVTKKINMMAKEELFKIPVLKWIIIKLKTFPVKRGAADRNAIKMAINLLKQGELVGIFPEGTRSKTAKLAKAQPGMAMIALKAGVPIIPAAIIGTNKVFKSGSFLPKFKIRYGKALYANQEKSDKENAEYLNEAVMAEIARLIELG